jgi:hypothetical protein
MQSPRGLVAAALILIACGDDTPATDDTTTSSPTTTETTGDGDTTSTTAEPSSSGVSSESSTAAADTSSSEGGTTTGGEDSGLELLVCSFVGDAVGRFDLDDGTFLGNLGETEDLDGALGIVVGPDGDIFVASEEANMVLRYSGADGSYVGPFVVDDPRTKLDETGGLSGPGAVLFAADGALLVSSFDSDAILRYDGTSGAFVDVLVPTGTGGLDGPDAGMVLGPDGNLYVPGYYSDSIPRYDAMTGDPLGDFTPVDMLAEPRTLVFAGDHLYVANEGTDEVLRYDAVSGAFVDVFVAAGAGGLAGPAGMVFDPSGVLHVASVDGNTVLRYDASGAPLPTLVDAEGGGIAAPTHIAIALAI